MQKVVLNFRAMSSTTDRIFYHSVIHIDSMVSECIMSLIVEF